MQDNPAKVSEKRKQTCRHASLSNLERMYLGEILMSKRADKETTRLNGRQKQGGLRAISSPAKPADLGKKYLPANAQRALHQNGVMLSKKKAKGKNAP